MRMALLDWQASAVGNRLKVAKELCAAEFPSFLAGEQVVRAVCRPLAQPCPECSRLIEQRLPAVLVERLYGVERTFESANRNRAGLEIDVGQFDSADLGRTETMPICQQDHCPIPRRTILRGFE